MMVQCSTLWNNYTKHGKSKKFHWRGDIKVVRVLSWSQYWDFCDRQFYEFIMNTVIMNMWPLPKQHTHTEKQTDWNTHKYKQIHTNIHRYRNNHTQVQPHKHTYMDTNIFSHMETQKHRQMKTYTKRHVKRDSETHIEILRVTLRDT